MLVRAAEEAAERDHRQLWGQRWTCPPPGRAHGSVFGDRTAGTSRALRPTCVAGSTGRLSGGRRPRSSSTRGGRKNRPGQSSATCSSSRTRSRARMEMRRSFQAKPTPDRAQADRDCPGHVLVLAGDRRAIAELPIHFYESAAATEQPHGALHGLMRVRRPRRRCAHLLPRRPDRVERTPSASSPRACTGDSRLRGLRHQARASARRPVRQRQIGTSGSRASPGGGSTGWRPTSSGGRSYQAKALSMRPSRVAPKDTIGTPGRWHAPVDQVLPERLVRPTSARTGASIAHHVPSRRSRVLRAVHRHPDRRLCGGSFPLWLARIRWWSRLWCRRADSYAQRKSRRRLARRAVRRNRAFATRR